MDLEAGIDSYQIIINLEYIKCITTFVNVTISYLADWVNTLKMLVGQKTIEVTPRNSCPM